MLFKVIISPVILNSVPSHSESQKHFFNSVIFLLTDLDKNCLILVDSENQIKEEFFLGIKGCPSKYRKKLKVLIKRLRKKFVVKTHDESCEVNCHNKSCTKSVKLAALYAPNAIFTTEDCCNCISLQDFGKRVIDFSEYSSSAFYELHRTSTLGSFLEKELRADDFEHRFIVPLFRESKHIKIYDRLIGNSILESGERGEKGLSIKKNYKKTLEWLASLFQRFSLPKASRRFIIYCGLDTTHLKGSKVDEVKRVISDFETSIKARVDFPFKIICKQEVRGERRFPHARYLMTEYTGIFVDRGFDLLIGKEDTSFDWENPQSDSKFISDVAIGLLGDSDRRKIERYVQSLNDI